MGEGFFVNPEEEKLHPKRILLGCVDLESSPALRRRAQLSAGQSGVSLLFEWEKVFLLIQKKKSRTTKEFFWMRMTSPQNQTTCSKNFSLLLFNGSCSHSLKNSFMIIFILDIPPWGMRYFDQKRRGYEKSKNCS